jgi:hypothetical protein
MVVLEVVEIFILTMELSMQLVLPLLSISLVRLESNLAGAVLVVLQVLEIFPFTMGASLPLTVMVLDFEAVILPAAWRILGFWEVPYLLRTESLVLFWFPI